MKKTPKELDRIVDKVLAFRPPPKIKEDVKKKAAEHLKGMEKAAD